MKAFLIETVKTVAGAVIIVVVLKVSGLLPTVTQAAQSAVIYSGLVNASDEQLADKENFNYDFTVKDLEGNRMPMSSLEGKVIFLNLWATWCGPCRAEMASIQKLYDRLDKTNIQFVMLSIDRDEDAAKVVSYINGREFTFPVFMPSGMLTDQTDVPSIPTTFIISKSGEIVSKKVGTTNFNTDKFKTFLEKLAAE